MGCEGADGVWALAMCGEGVRVDFLSLLRRDSIWCKLWESRMTVLWAGICREEEALDEWQMGVKTGSDLDGGWGCGCEAGAGGPETIGGLSRGRRLGVSGGGGGGCDSRGVWRRSGPFGGGKRVDLGLVFAPALAS